MYFPQPHLQNNANYSIPFDGTVEEFASSFPISLANRVHPQQFASTLQQCTFVMKQHMAKITESDRKVKWIALACVALTVFIIAFSTVMVTAVTPVQDETVWIPAVFIPIVSICPMIVLIIYSAKRMKQIKEIHLECKRELEALIDQENQQYYQMGVQWILRYNVEAVGKVRYSVYKHLNIMPVLEILVNQGMFVVPQQQQQLTGIVSTAAAAEQSNVPLYQQHALYVQPSSTTANQHLYVAESQPHSVVTYQQVNQYQKENDQQPLLMNNRV